MDVVPEGKLWLLLPEAYGTEPEFRARHHRWHKFKPASDGFYVADVTRYSVNSELHVRYRGPDGRRRFAAAQGTCENLNGRLYVARPPLAPIERPPRTGQAKVCLECPLESLLAGFGDAAYAPREIQEMLLDSISDRMLRAGIPTQIARREIDEVMAPVFPSVADRARLNPKFNYLTYAVGEVDWQIGRPEEFAALISGFHSAGLRLIPDLIFAHFVRGANPVAMDTVADANGKKLYVDDDPYLFRDYGTWMYDLANPGVRSFLVQKIAGFLRLYGLDTFRLDYVDGIALQYSRREVNFGDTFLRELNAALRKLPQDITVIGEAFSTRDRESVRELIDVPYMPRGFTIAEILYCPASKSANPSKVDVVRLAQEIEYGARGDEPEAVYAQLHDETWYDPHIREGRPHVPWAYGAFPAQLARHVARDRVGLGLLAGRDTLDFVRKRVRTVESMTMFAARYRYMMTPAVDSLTLGRFDKDRRWVMEWNDPTPIDMISWRKTGLTDAMIFHLHDRHRHEMRRLRAIWREWTPIDEENGKPLVELEVLMADEPTSVLIMLRRVPGRREGTHLVVWNLGAHEFFGEMTFKIPLPLDLGGHWKVLFDGDYISPDDMGQGGRSAGYDPGYVLGTEDNGRLELAVKLRKWGILVLGLGEPYAEEARG